MLSIYVPVVLFIQHKTSECIGLWYFIDMQRILCFVDRCALCFDWSEADWQPNFMHMTCRPVMTVAQGNDY